MNTGAQGIIIHPHSRQQHLIAQLLEEMGLNTQTANQCHSFEGYSPELGSVWVIFDEGVESVQFCARIRMIAQSTFWGILIVGQGSEDQRQALINAGADSYLPYPFDRSKIISQVRSLLDKRTPVSAYQVLPIKLAAAIDKVFLKLETLNYYSLLEMKPGASSEEIQTRFHQRSLVLHPDRHRGLKKTHPQVYEKVNQIYKRLLEAYRVLSQPLKRLMYQAALTRGVIRWNTQTEKQLKEVLSLSTSPSVQYLLVEAMSLKSRGQLAVAHMRIQEAITLEPNHQIIKELELGYRKLMEVIQRDPLLVKELPREYRS